MELSEGVTVSGICRARRRDVRECLCERVLGKAKKKDPQVYKGHGKSKESRCHEGCTTSPLAQTDTVQIISGIEMF